MKTKILLFACLAFLTLKNQAQTVTDIDGNVYNTVTIGTQVWMKENLKVKHYRNGDNVQYAPDSTKWPNLTIGAWCYYNSDSTFQSTYGLLYNWWAVNDSNKIAPLGWHIPSVYEWQTLLTFLGGNGIAGGKMKEAGTIHWLNPNAGATNESGFTALPAGMRYYANGQYMDLGHATMIWSSTTDYLKAAYNCYLGNTFSEATIAYVWLETGLPVRCVKDTTAVLINENDIENHPQIFPNPATSLLTINCPGSENLIVSVFDVFGKLVLQKNLDGGKNEIDISSLMNGLYLIQVSGSDWTVQKKIIKE